MVHKMFHAQNRVVSAPIPVGLGRGLLYNGYVNDESLFFPIDLVMPSDADFLALKTELDPNSGNHMKVPGTEFWGSDSGADNSSDFSGIGGGTRQNSNGDFNFLDTYAFYWTSDVVDPLNTKAWWLTKNSVNFDYYTDINPKNGCSIRPKYIGALTGGDVFVDYDGNAYDIIQIGSNKWLKQNWKCTHLNDGTIIPNVTDNTSWINLTTIGRCAFDNNPALV